jgi:hypothetical protein
MKNKNGTLPSLPQLPNRGTRMVDTKEAAPLKKLTPAEVCDRISKLGYSIGRRIRLYGEEMEVVSDPFLQDGLIAVRVRGGDASEQLIYLPTKILLCIR